jgi:hypothetical protein
MEPNSEESFEESSQPSLLRQSTGIDIDPEIGIDYYLIRCIAVNNDSENGDMKIDDLEKELFEGLKEIWPGFVIEYFGLPSTMLYNGCSVVMASQIYEREYTNSSAKYDTVNTYTEYYNKRHEIINKKLKIDENYKPQITWLGKPSIVFSYRDRNILKNYLHTDPVINYFFWITSFNSSGCIADYFKQYEGKDRLYCENYQTVKVFCKNPERYQIHDTFMAYHKRKYLDTHTNNDNDDVKFLTDFNKAVQRISIEDEAIDRYNNDNETNFFQRYNEVFTYFFPWDIDGIEMGNISTDQMNKLLINLETWRNRANDVINEMVEDTELIDKLNNIINVILENNPMHTKKLIKEKFDDKYTYFLVAKFLLLAECDFIQHQPNYLLKCSDNDRIRGLLSEISGILKKPLKIYEYVLVSQDSNKFNMIHIGDYDSTTPYELRRSSHFTLLEQKQDSAADPSDPYAIPEKKLTKVYLSKKQLVSVRGGGRKLRRTMNRWRKTRINKRKTRTQKRNRRKTRKHFCFF